MINRAEKIFPILKNKDFKIFAFVLLFYFGTKIIISFISYFGLSVLPIRVFPDDIGWAGMETDFWIRLANWDGGHFRGIAENGYLYSFQVVFFPLYPILINALLRVSVPSLWGGFIISNLSAVAGLFFLYKLVLIDYSENIARKTIFIYLAFPTAFYFGTVYSESLFLFLSVASFYFARKEKWGTAFLFASLSSATRLIGIAVIISIALEYFLSTSKFPSIFNQKNKISLKATIYLGLFILISIFLSTLAGTTDQYLALGLFKFLTEASILIASVISLSLIIFYLLKHLDYSKLITKPAAFLILSFLPFFAYCLFLKTTQGSYFAFINHEAQWQRHLGLPWAAPIDYFMNLLSLGFFRIGSSAQILIEFLFFIIFFVLLLISYFKMRISYFFFFVASLIIPLSSGTLQAIHRYGLVIFPAMILLANIKNETAMNLWIYFSLMLQGLLLVLFINSYWVS